MKIKRILAGVIASAMAISAMAITASAADEYEAYLGGGTDGWSTNFWGSEKDDEVTEGITSKRTTVTGDGQYTVGIETDQDFEMSAYDVLGVYVKLGKDFPIDIEDENSPLNITIDEIKVDGEVVDYDASKTLVYGQDGELKAELVNVYNNDAPNDFKVMPKESIYITFTVSGTGIGGDKADDADKEEKPADDANKDEKPADNPTTGMPIAGAGLVVLATASLAAATIIKKK